MALLQKSSPRYKLKTLAKQLRRLSVPTSPVSTDLARFAADGFEKYLSGKAKSLDAAFGLRKNAVPQGGLRSDYRWRD